MHVSTQRAAAITLEVLLLSTPVPLRKRARNDIRKVLRQQSPRSVGNRLRPCTLIEEPALLIQQRLSTGFTLEDKMIETTDPWQGLDGSSAFGLAHGPSAPRLRREYNVLEKVLEEIDDEIRRLEQARTILGASLGASRVTRPSRPGDSTRQARPPRRSALSVRARRAIAEAQRRRWAKVKSQKKTTSSSAMEEKEAAAS
jgi:hypothetical protein